MNEAPRNEKMVRANRRAFASTAPGPVPSKREADALLLVKQVSPRQGGSIWFVVAVTTEPIAYGVLA